MKPTRVFLNLQPVGHKKPAGADPFTYRETRPLRYRASWWTRGTSTEMYRSKPVATEEEAVRLARKWLDRQNKESLRWIDTTPQPERFGYSIEAPQKKTPRQLEAEIADAIGEDLIR